MLLAYLGKQNVNNNLSGHRVFSSKKITIEIMLKTFIYRLFQRANSSKNLNLIKEILKTIYLEIQELYQRNYLKLSRKYSFNDFF
jgi:hypothetical protein